MNIAKLLLKSGASLCLLAVCAAVAAAQSEGDIASVQYEGSYRGAVTAFAEPWSMHPPLP